jgi:hypothetical protein
MQDQIVIVAARDWSHFGAQVDNDSVFDLIIGEVCGFLISEDEEKIVIAHERFVKENQLRHITAIPKANVVNVSRFPIEEKTE